MTEEEDQNPPPGRFPDGEVISTFNYKVYARAGLSRDEADEWAARGVRPYHAEAFRQAGFDMDEAAALSALGVTGQFAATCRQAGFDMEEITELSALGVTGQFVADCRQAGKDPTEAFRRLQEIEAEKERVAAQQAAAAREAHARATQERAEAKARAEVEILSHADLGTGDIADLAQRSDSQISRWANETGAFGEPVRKVDGAKRYRANTVVDFLRTKDPGVDARATPIWVWGAIVQSLPPGLKSAKIVAALVAIASAARGGVAGVETRQRVRISELHLTTKKGSEEFRSIALPLRNLPERGQIVSDIDPLLDALTSDTYRHLPACLELALDAEIAPYVLLDDALDALAGGESDDELTPTPHALAEVMISLAEAEIGRSHEPGSPLVVFDPAAGTGELLMWFARRVGRSTEIEVRGRELNPDLARIARTRLMLRGLTGTIEVGNSLPVRRSESGHEWKVPPRIAADVILADLPFTNDRAKLNAWVNQSLRSLNSGGCAVLMLPTNAMPGPDETFDDKRPTPLFLRPGHLAGLALFSSRIRPGARDDVAVAVFTKERTTTVGFVDLSGEKMSTSSRMVTPSRRSPSSGSVTALSTTSSRDWVQRKQWSVWPEMLTHKQLAQTLADRLAASGQKATPTKPSASDKPRRLAEQLLATLGDSPEDQALAASLRARFGL